MGRTTRAAAEARSMAPISAFRLPRWSLGQALLAAEILVPVEDRVPPEERDHAAERQERAERDRLLARVSAVPHEEHRRGDERDEEPDEHRDDHREAEPRAEERGELDVTHAET